MGNAHSAVVPVIVAAAAAPLIPIVAISAGVAATVPLVAGAVIATINAVNAGQTPHHPPEHNHDHARQNPRLKDLEKQIQEHEAQVRGAEEARLAEENLRRANEHVPAAEDSARQQEEERHRADEARRAAEAEAQKAESARRVAEEQRQQAEEYARRAQDQQSRAEAEGRRALEERERAQREAERARQIAAEAHAAWEETQRRLREGIRPIIIPTSAEFNATKKRLQYKEGLFHFAIAGIAGSGKSSLVNALSGLCANDKDAAEVGVTETTSVVTRYPNPGNDMPFVWYDVPGTGTLSIPDWQYFTAQGLYIFDAIIVLFDNRFTESDIAILRNCVRFQIPAYIVRSKAKQHIENMVADMGGDDLEDRERAELKAQAREHYVLETRASVARNLTQAELPAKRVYLVDSVTLARIVKAGTQEVKPDERLTRDCVDELELLRDFHGSRYRPQ